MFFKYFLNAFHYQELFAAYHQGIKFYFVHSKLVNDFSIRPVVLGILGSSCIASEQYLSFRFSEEYLSFSLICQQVLMYLVFYFLMLRPIHFQQNLLFYFLQGYMILEVEICRDLLCFCSICKINSIFSRLFAFKIF